MKDRTLKLVLIGGGGHASDVLSVAEMLGETVIGFQDDRHSASGRFYDRAIYLGRIGEPCEAEGYLWGIGWPDTRMQLLSRMTLEPATLVHPAAHVAANASIGQGTIVLAGAVVSAGASIGDHAVVHHNSIVGHDCQIEDFVSVLPGAVLSGDSTLGRGCMIGSNATVLQGLSIGPGARIGAGSVVTRDVSAGVKAIGSPARPR